MAPPPAPSPVTGHLQDETFITGHCKSNQITKLPLFLPSNTVATFVPILRHCLDCNALFILFFALSSRPSLATSTLYCSIHHSSPCHHVRTCMSHHLPLSTTQHQVHMITQNAICSRFTAIHHCLFCFNSLIQYSMVWYSKQGL